jgi:hypothetical protein
MASQKELMYNFGYDISKTCGIGQMMCLADVLIQEAHLLNRKAILMPLYLSSLHNRGIEKKTSWKKYFNFDDYENIGPESDEKILTVPYYLPTNKLKLIPNKRIQRDLGGKGWLYQFGQFLPKRYKFYNASAELFVPNYKNFNKPSLWSNFSKEINNLVLRINKRLGSYYALHIRRWDCADASTEPPRIKEFLLRTLPLNSKIFIMSDERNKKYWHYLKKQFNIILETDIKEFVEIWEHEQDNYKIYLAAEKIRSLASKDLGVLSAKEYLENRNIS